ncbi:MAG: SH3 domain-containing protein [Ferruginibacter sp.]
MKKVISVFYCLVAANFVMAQQKIVYNAYKPGLSIRDKPGAQGTVTGKIPYGEKLTLVNTFNDTVQVTNEGMSGYWNQVEYKGQKGYVVGIYLLEMAPPLATIKTTAAYFSQVSVPAGAPVTATTGKDDDEMHSRFKKQLFKNGCEIHEAHFYESGYNTYFIPGLTLQQGFILVRLIPEFKDVFGIADSYPAASKKIRISNPSGGGEKEIKVYKEEGSNFIYKITVGYEDGAVYEFEMYELHGQLVISFGGGV